MSAGWAEGDFEPATISSIGSGSQTKPGDRPGYRTSSVSASSWIKAAPANPIRRRADKHVKPVTVVRPSVEARIKAARKLARRNGGPMTSF